MCVFFTDEGCYLSLFDGVEFFFYEKGSVGSVSVVGGFVFVFSIWGLQVCL